MFDFILSSITSVVRDLLWTAAAALLAYTLNKLQSHFQNS
jgi:hypothetical protein